MGATLVLAVLLVSAAVGNADDGLAGAVGLTVIEETDNGLFSSQSANISGAPLCVRPSGAIRNGTPCKPNSFAVTTAFCSGSLLHCGGLSVGKPT